MDCFSFSPRLSNSRAQTLPDLQLFHGFTVRVGSSFRYVRGTAFWAECVSCSLLCLLRIQFGLALDNVGQRLLLLSLRPRQTVLPLTIVGGLIIALLFSDALALQPSITSSGG